MAIEDNRPEDPSKEWFRYFYSEHGRDSPAETRIALLAVAIIVFALTFHAGLHPPGGVWQDDVVDDSGKVLHYAGTSILGSSDCSHSRTELATFILTNSLAFYGSLSIIVGLIFRSSYHIELLITLTATGLTYIISISAITPPEIPSSGYLFLAMVMPTLLRIVQQIANRIRSKMVLKAAEAVPGSEEYEPIRCGDI